MLNIIIADAELELVPKELWSFPDALSYSRRRSKKLSEVLLDSNYMHRAIESVFPGESTRRGRPDIIHTLLLTCQESILNKVGMLRVFIHTRENKVIIVNWQTRIPRSFNRFAGLIEDLFDKKKIQNNGLILLEMIDSTIREFISSKGFRNVRIFAPDQKLRSLSDAIGIEDETTLIIGGFSEGKFRSDLDGLGEKYSIYPEELTIWTVAMEAICTYERLHSVVT
jgi:rRNA small subunit pseudouridine methyltransferase Nep1